MHVITAFYNYVKGTSIAQGSHGAFTVSMDAINSHAEAYVTAM